MRLNMARLKIVAITFNPVFILIAGRILPLLDSVLPFLVIPWTLLAPLVISTEGRTKTENSSGSSVLATAAICTISSLLTSRPVVSRSKKTRRGGIVIESKSVVPRQLRRCHKMSHLSQASHVEATFPRGSNVVKQSPSHWNAL